MLRNWLLKLKKREIEKSIKTYYLSLSGKEKREDREWTKIVAESTKRTWID
jgi:hypothetical protein